MISHLVGAISFHFLFLQDFSLEKEDEGEGGLVPVFNCARKNARRGVSRDLYSPVAPSLLSYNASLASSRFP